MVHQFGRCCSDFATRRRLADVRRAELDHDGDAAPRVEATKSALTSCSQGAAPEPKSVAAGSLPGEHIHGISRDPGSGKVNLATHEGLFVMQPDASWKQVGPVVDLMSFAITGPGSFYASGHPAEGVDMPAPVG